MNKKKQKQIGNPKSLSECVKIVHEYNEKKGTYYSYGNFPHKELFENTEDKNNENQQND